MALLACLLVSARPCAAAERASAAPPLPGFTLHWDFVNSPAELDRLLTFTLDQGARILNVVPPPHIWEDPTSLAALEHVFERTRARGVAVVLNRIDGSGFARSAAERSNWLYTNVLTEPGRLPSGEPTPDYFLATVGKPDYERWLREETAFYAEHFSGQDNLLAFGVGLFNEPFVSQRGALLCYDERTRLYEVGQYTRYAREVFQRYVERACHGSLAEVNRRYRTHCGAIAELPLPKNEYDPAFGDAPAAYWDFLAAINGWVVDQLEACRALWKDKSRRPVPFMLQFNGAVPEKFALGRPAFAALDVVDWISRADALGLSFYTNCGFADWGHASDRATVGLLGLGALLGKAVYVLEAGSECDGAVLRRGELEFFARSVRPLAPRSVIYEFTKMSYCESFATNAGKLMDNEWRINARAAIAVRRALAEAQRPDARSAGRLVFDPLDERPDARALLERWALMRRSLQEPLTFVTRAALDALPAGSTLYVGDGREHDGDVARLATRGVRVRPVRSLIGGTSPTPRGSGRSSQASPASAVSSPSPESPSSHRRGTP